MIGTKYTFKPCGDNHGKLIALEEFRNIPFQIKRVYYIYNTEVGFIRGKHAHKKLEQVLVCVNGSCKIKLDNGEETRIITLETPCEGLYVGKNVWREMFDFSRDAVLLVLASELYDPNDYIRDYNEFIEYITGDKNW